MPLVKIIKSTGRVLWKQRELPSVTVLFFRSMTSTVVSHKGLAGAAVIGALVLLRVTVPWAEGSIHTGRTFPYTSIGFPVNLSNATARRSFCPCAILSSNYGRAVLAHRLVTGTSRRDLFLIPASSLKYIPKCLKRVCVNALGQWCFSLREHFTHMMPSVPLGNYCENLRGFVGGSGGKLIQIEDDSDKCSFSGKARQKQLSTDKWVRLTLRLKYCKWQRQNCRPLRKPVGGHLNVLFKNH